MPSEPTIRRVLQQVDADEVDVIVTGWRAAKSRRLGDAIAVDGKSLRGSGHGARSRAVHLLAGFVHRTGQVIGQVDVERKTHEIPMVRELLDPLEITGQIVTVDAWMRCIPNATRPLIWWKTTRPIR